MNENEIQSLKKKLFQAYREIDDLNEQLKKEQDETEYYMMLLGGLKAKIHLKQIARNATSRN